MEDYYNFAKEIRAQGKYGIISNGTPSITPMVFKWLWRLLLQEKADGTLDPNDIGLDNEGAVQGAEYLRKFIDNTVPLSIFGDDGLAKLTSSL